MIFRADAVYIAGSTMEKVAASIVAEAAALLESSFRPTSPGWTK